MEDAWRMHGGCMEDAWRMNGGGLEKVAVVFAIDSLMP